MKTITIQIGNTDDKLSQERWSAFYIATLDACLSHGDQVHFSGHSEPDARWQNACFVVVTVSEPQYNNLRRKVAQIRWKFDQDSVAWTEGSTVFI